MKEKDVLNFDLHRERRFRRESKPRGKSTAVYTSPDRVVFGNVTIHTTLEKIAAFLSLGGVLRYVWPRCQTLHQTKSTISLSLTVLSNHLPHVRLKREHEKGELDDLK